LITAGQHREKQTDESAPGSTATLLLRNVGLILTKKREDFFLRSEQW
jgi:hypothetical protein